MNTCDNCASSLTLLIVFSINDCTECSKIDQAESRYGYLKVKKVSRTNN